MDFTVAAFVAADNELTDLVKLGAPAISIQEPMTAEFISWDQDTPVTEELSEDLEKNLVQRHKEGLPAETDPTDEEPEPEPELEPLRLKIHTDTMEVSDQCELYRLEKSEKCEKC